METQRRLKYFIREGIIIPVCPNGRRLESKAFNSLKGVSLNVVIDVRRNININIDVFPECVEQTTKAAKALNSLIRVANPERTNGRRLSDGFKQGLNSLAEGMAIPERPNSRRRLSDVFIEQGFFLLGRGHGNP